MSLRPIISPPNLFFDTFSCKQLSTSKLFVFIPPYQTESERDYKSHLFAFLCKSRCVIKQLHILVYAIR